MVLLLILSFLLGNLYLPISWTIISAGILSISCYTHSEDCPLSIFLRSHSLWYIMPSRIQCEEWRNNLGIITLTETRR